MGHLKRRVAFIAAILELDRDLLCSHDTPGVRAGFEDTPVAPVVSFSRALLAGVMTSTDDYSVCVRTFQPILVAFVIGNVISRRFDITYKHAENGNACCNDGDTRLSISPDE